MSSNSDKMKTVATILAILGTIFGGVSLLIRLFEKEET